jgi:hypothetical protein
MNEDAKFHIWQISWPSSIEPNKSILTENPLAGKADQKNSTKSLSANSLQWKKALD